MKENFKKGYIELNKKDLNNHNIKLNKYDKKER